MTKIQSIYAFAGMVATIGVVAFGVFKWTDTQQDADEDIGKWMKQQEVVHSGDSLFKIQVIDEFQQSRILMDSAIHIALQNQRAIGANRRVIVKQIKEDTSLSGRDVFELLQPLMEGVEDLKKNESSIVFVE